jgi:glycosyltransferase involved in cell wall biosynthesis
MRRLSDLAQALGVASRLRFHGPKSRDAVAAAYGAADALLFPVRWAEPFGAVPLEALACGTPVVATGTGGTAEYLRPERNALIVPPEDPQAVAAAVTRLRADAGLRQRLRSTGRITAERYPAELSHQRLREALEAAARRRNAMSRST